VNTSHTPEEGVHSPNWPNEIVIIIIISHPLRGRPEPELTKRAYCLSSSSSSIRPCGNGIEKALAACPSTKVSSIFGRELIDTADVLRDEGFRVSRRFKADILKKSMKNPKKYLKTETNLKKLNPKLQMNVEAHGCTSNNTMVRK
jgi:hypothetical protein